MLINNKIIKAFSLMLVLILLVIPCLTITTNAKDINDVYNKEYLVGGLPFGVKIISKGLTVVKFSDNEEESSSAYAAGIKIGDVITKINGKAITGCKDFTKEIEESLGKSVELTILRKGKELNITLSPKYSKSDGKYKTGIWVKDSTTGIGTITYVDPETGEFGGLGHGICDSTSGRVIPVTYGVVLDVSINGVNKGVKGTAGELKGTFEFKKLGTLTKNCDCGVFGYLKTDKLSCPEKLKICPKNQVKTGDAYIWCTLDDGQVEKYAIKITEIIENSNEVKNFKVKVTDQRLLDKAGGIVQGMSGSPIVQNGKLVGAVTHVLINDPTCGYGIFIENMLNSSTI
ncbi:MAG: SpoIVB peptidase [Clostridia bacterium]|nr:SpoIVB peptidase [Clostridia bacterium]